MDGMVIDLTNELAPVLWAIVGLLLMTGGAIAANIDTEVAEIYHDNRRMIVIVATLAIVVLAVLAVIQPGIAISR
jgi:hypothetical protein